MPNKKIVLTDKHFDIFYKYIYIFLVLFKFQTYLCQKFSQSMKKLFLLVLSGAPDILFAQHRLEAGLNLPRAGDEIIKQQVEYKNPGRAGENVLWDFGQLKSQNDEYELVYVLGRDSLLTGIEHHTRYYYSSTGDSLLLWGYENATTLMENEQPELLLRFPVSFGDSTFCYYNGNGQYSNRLKIDAMGTLTSKADARGMMILPGGDTLKNVIRIHTVKRIAGGSKPLFFSDLDDSLPVSPDSIEYRLANDTILLGVETYRWYVQGYRYPVFETVKSITDKRGEERTFFDTAFFYPPQEHYYLEDDEENRTILETQEQGKKDNPLADVRFNAFPNPVSTTLDVEIFLPVEAKIKLQIRSVANKNVYINENKGKFAQGSHQFQLYVSQLPPGYYLLNIWADNYLLSETILKR